MPYADPEAAREQKRRWKRDNPDKVRASGRRRYANNRQRLLAYALGWIARNPEKKRKSSRDWNARNRDRCRQKKNAWADANKAHVRAYNQNRLATQPSAKIRATLSSRIHDAIRNYRGVRKATKTIELIGCSIETLKLHLESQFQPGMSWDNYGPFGWHIDHRRACATFDLTDPQQQRTCFHFTNLQPLWWRDNIAKGARTT